MAGCSERRYRKRYSVHQAQTINSFSSDTGIWCVGNATSAYGSYKALQLAIENDASFPLTVEVTAAGYNKLTMEVAKATVNYNDVYTATVKISETEPTTPPTEPTKEPTPVEDTDPPDELYGKF